MAYGLIILLVLGVVFAPSLWSTWILKRHNRARPDIPGTGAQLAEHLVEELGLEGVSVERTDQGSHYDPDAKAVRLEPDYFDTCSVAAVAVAAHEIGHAVQDSANYRPLITRQKLVQNTLWVQKTARIVLYAAPFLALLGRHPGIMLVALLAGVFVMSISAIIHLVTLPVEFDASFARALPVLQKGGYLSGDDMPAARAVLWACALTYVAGALVSMLNLARWIRVIP